MSPDQVVQSHRDNFAINYSEVVSVNVVQTLTVHGITILTRDDKFEFSTRARFNDVVELFTKTLNEKLSVRRLSQSELQRGVSPRMCMALLFLNITCDPAEGSFVGMLSYWSGN